MIEVSALNIFPVKSLQGIARTQVELGVCGLAYDRHWMVSDAAYHFVTQRQIPRLATIKVSMTAAALTLAHADSEPLVIDLHGRHKRTVRARVWKDKCQALDEGQAAARWLSNILGAKDYPVLRLLRCSPGHQRQVAADHLSGEQAHTAFADAYPFLITAEESLAALNENLRSRGAENVTMDRFRANIVIRGLEAFAEDELASLRHAAGSYRLGLRKPCQRCKITSIDQKTERIKTPKEPLKTLSMMNQSPTQKAAFFGQNAILLDGAGAHIRVGDRLLP